MARKAKKDVNPASVSVEEAQFVQVKLIDKEDIPHNEVEDIPQNEAEDTADSTLMTSGPQEDETAVPAAPVSPMHRDEMVQETEPAEVGQPQAQEEGTMPTCPDSVAPATGERLSVSSIIARRGKKPLQGSCLQEEIRKRKNGGKTPMTLQGLIKERKTGRVEGSTVESIIYERKYGRLRR